MKYFGTDGIRTLGEKLLENKFSQKVGIALSRLDDKKKIVCIAQDTRVTGEAIKNDIGSALLSEGHKVIDLGIIPTPALAYLTVKNKANFGIMISASHNPPEYNGIKIFNQDGYKISEDQEKTIENGIDLIDKINIADLSQSIIKQDGAIEYINYVVDYADINLDGISIKIDCGYGASSYIAKQVFEKLGANVISICDEHLGEKINVDCGSTNILNLSIDESFDIGFAYDGDADRVIGVDPLSNVLDGDLFMYIIAMYLKKFNKLASNTVVATSMSNIALEISLKKEGIKLIRTDVGDKYVQREMVLNGYAIGGEQSGHIILNGPVKTGDGILSSVILIKAIKALNLDFKSVGAILKPYPQRIENIITEKKSVLSDKKVTDALEDSEKILEGNGRIVLRASGTEPKIRIMVESSDEKIMEEAIEIVKKAIIALI